MSEQPTGTRILAIAPMPGRPMKDFRRAVGPARALGPAGARPHEDAPAEEGKSLSATSYRWAVEPLREVTEPGQRRYTED